MRLAGAAFRQNILPCAALNGEGFWAETPAMLAAQAMLPLFVTIALYNDTVRVLMHENAF